MKQPLAFALALLFVNLAQAADLRAVTERGDEVILSDDGRWQYVKAPKEVDSSIGVNPGRFKRPADASFAVRSTKNSASVYINPKKWTFAKAKPGTEREFTFRLSSGDLYGMLITERMVVPLETLVQAALSNMRASAPDAEIVKQEYRQVNDKKVLLLQMHASMQGMKIMYRGYYFTDESGTTQLVTYTSQALAAVHAADAEDFLNGFTVQP